MIAPTGPRVRSLAVDRSDDRRRGAYAGARQSAAPLERRSATCSSGWASRAYWTYDPFVTRTAHRNLTRLGADVVEYVPDMYEDSQSPLHRRVRTDRFGVVWCIGADRVTTAALRELPSAGAHAPVANPADAGEPASDGPLLLQATVLCVDVPRDIRCGRRRSSRLPDGSGARGGRSSSISPTVIASPATRLLQRRRPWLLRARRAGSDQRRLSERGRHSAQPRPTASLFPQS